MNNVEVENTDDEEGLLSPKSQMTRVMMTPISRRKQNMESVNSEGGKTQQGLTPGSLIKL